MQTEWENLSDPIFHYALARPDAPAVSAGGSTVTYTELADRIAKASDQFREIEIGRAHV